MAPSRKGDLTASMAILGLVIEQADTINGVRLRLAERFPNTGWSRSIAYSAMSSLAGQGSLRLVRSGAERSLDLYEATPAGIDSFKQWLRAFSAAPPVLLDALRAKLQYVADEDDLRAVLEAIREQEEVCIEESEQARMRMLKAERLGQLDPPRGADWRSRLQSALLTDEMLLWGDIGKRLRRFRQDLEGAEERLERPRGGGGYDR